MSLPTTDVDALLTKLNQYAGAADTNLSDSELAFLREQLTTKKKYGLIWEDKPEAVEQQLQESLPVLTEVIEKRVAGVARDVKSGVAGFEPATSGKKPAAQTILTFESSVSASLPD